MDRINHASAEADKFGPGKDGWTNGDPADESSGTVPQADWFDGVQEELVTIIEAAGLTPSNGDYTQLAASILNKVTGTYTADANLRFSGITDDQTARVSDHTNPTNDRFLALSFGPAGQRINIYYSTGTSGLNNSVEIASNCYWLQGTGWVSAGVNEGLITLGTFADVDGPRIIMESVLVSNAFTSYFAIQGEAGAPVGTVDANTLYGKAATKAYGYVKSVSGVVTTSANSVGLSAALEGGGPDIRVTWDNAFTDTDYFVSVTPIGTLDRFYSVAIPSANYCLVDLRTLSAGTGLDFSTSDGFFMIEAKGQQ